ncbi:MAG: CDP-diacylglycerol--glycerol-3-phosphate 3-phosphatidyltransferase [Gammaproteobacteria bacterium]|nr:CDP-diacylglycerol--glycerol-3-phosphate 3-phosphatidyltransferase [Gammaproteobacteria bacterium]
MTAKDGNYIAYVPNAVTLIRIACIPLFVLIYVITEEWHWVAGLLFGFAAATDWLDGYIARKWEVDSKFGAFLDPVADKLIVITALVLLVGSYASVWITIPAIVICARELFVSALREWMAEMNRRSIVNVSLVGKVKTAIQMIAIFALLCNPVDIDLPLVIAGIVLLYIATLMTIWSMVVLLRAAWPDLMPFRE